MKGALKGRMKPLLLKLGLALSLGLAGYLYSHLRAKRIQPSIPPGEKVHIDEKRGLEELHLQETHDKEETPNKSADHAFFIMSPSSKSSAENENLLLPEFSELVLREFESAAACTPGGRDVEAHMQGNKFTWDPLLQEVLLLRNRVNILQERERNLEVQLLEYYGMKEKHFAMRELENRLKINTVEAKFFALKIESLRADNRRLEAQVADHSKIVSELESARAKIKHLKRKIKSDEEQNSGKLSALQEKVAALQREEHQKDAIVLRNIDRIKDLEGELEKMRQSFSELECKNLELAKKLETAQILASNVSENQPVSVMEEETKCLRQDNQQLKQEIELLQADRCADVEEVVYLRWVNACLRYELRNYQPPPGKLTARDFNKSLSPRSEERAKQLILDYANTGNDDNNSRFIDYDSEYWSSSQESTITEASDFDESLLGSSINHRRSGSSKSKFFTKLKKLMSGKEGSSSHERNKANSLNRTDSSCCYSERRTSVASSEEALGTYLCQRTSSCAHMNPGSKLFNNLQILAANPRGVKERVDNERREEDLLASESCTPRPSLQAITGASQEGAKDNGVRSSFELKRRLSREDCEIDMKCSEAPEKLELLKFAQALKTSR